MKKKKYIIIAIAAGILGILALYFLPPLITHVKRETVRKAIKIVNFHDASRRNEINGQISSLSEQLIETKKRIDSLERQVGVLEKGVIFKQPASNYIFQRNNNGLADLPYEFINLNTSLVTTVQLKTEIGNEIIVSKRHTDNHYLNAGVFSAVKTGKYQLCLSQKALEDVCMSIAVGDVYLVAGQSNAVSGSQSPSYSQSGIVGVCRLPFLQRCYFPTKTSPIRHSVAWLTLGDLIAENYQIPTGFINVASGSTSTSDWVPGEGLFGRIEEVLNNRRIRAILWHQGESDFAGFYPFESSFANMEKMILESHKYYPDIQWVVAINSGYNVDHPNPKRVADYIEQGVPIRMAQMSIINQGLALKGPDTDLIREDDKAKGSFDFEGEFLQEHGKMWFNAMKVLYK